MQPPLPFYQWLILLFYLFLHYTSISIVSFWPHSFKYVVASCDVLYRTKQTILYHYIVLTCLKTFNTFLDIIYIWFCQRTNDYREWNSWNVIINWKEESHRKEYNKVKIGVKKFRKSAYVSLGIQGRSLAKCSEIWHENIKSWKFCLWYSWY